MDTWRHDNHSSLSSPWPWISKYPVSSMGNPRMLHNKLLDILYIRYSVFQYYCNYRILPITSASAIHKGTGNISLKCVLNPHSKVIKYPKWKLKTYLGCFCFDNKLTIWILWFMCFNEFCLILLFGKHRPLSYGKPCTCFLLSK